MDVRFTIEGRPRVASLWLSGRLARASGLLLISASAALFSSATLAATDPWLTELLMLKLAKTSAEKKAAQKTIANILKARKKSDADLDPVANMGDAFVVDERNADQLERAEVHKFSHPVGPLVKVDRGPHGEVQFAPIGELAIPVVGRAQIVGTAFLVGPCTVATAGHAVPDEKGHFSNYPDKVAAGDQMFRIGWSKTSRFKGHTATTFLDGQAAPRMETERLNDYAFLKLTSCVGMRYGWLTPVNWDTVKLDHEYPAMKVGYPSSWPEGDLAKRDCSAIIIYFNRGDFKRHAVIDNCGSEEGMSGGPLFIKQDGDWRVVGINSGWNTVFTFAGREFKSGRGNDLDAPLYGAERFSESDQRTNPLPQMIKEGRFVAREFDDPTDD